MNPDLHTRSGVCLLPSTICIYLHSVRCEHPRHAHSRPHESTASGVSSPSAITSGTILSSASAIAVLRQQPRWHKCRSASSAAIAPVPATHIGHRGALPPPATSIRHGAGAPSHIVHAVVLCVFTAIYSGGVWLRKPKKRRVTRASSSPCGYRARCDLLGVVPALVVAELQAAYRAHDGAKHLIDVCTDEQRGAIILGRPLEVDLPRKKQTI